LNATLSPHNEIRPVIATEVGMVVTGSPAAKLVVELLLLSPL